MTRRAIVVLALVATLCLAIGANLLDAATPPRLVLAVLALVVGTGCAAAAVAGAWRSPVPAEQGRQPSSD
jgi:hypothetical protein